MPTTPPSRFEASVDAREPSLPFAGATGKGIRVAVIDSGVYPQHPHIASVAGGISFLGPEDNEEHSFLDRLGHGTAVMAAIQEKAPQAEYLAVKIFHHSLRATSPTVLAAIEWSLDQGVNVINLSLGTLAWEYENHFRELIGRASAQHTILVSALGSADRPCLPGSLPGVLGVVADPDCPRTRYGIDTGPTAVSYRASGYPRPVPGVPKEANLQGVSFAVANMTGFVIRALEWNSAEDVHEVLAREEKSFEHTAKSLDP